jgi:hypothetical protein
MLQNAYFLAKFGADTAENEQHFAEIFSLNYFAKNWQLPYGSVLETALAIDRTLARRCVFSLSSPWWTSRIRQLRR